MGLYSTPLYWVACIRKDPKGSIVRIGLPIYFDKRVEKLRVYASQQ